MYAIVETGGKQYKVEKDLLVKVEKLDTDAKTVKLDVLMLVEDGSVLVGKDIESAYVEAEIVKQDKDAKVVVYKYKSKKNERKRQGHRQPYTLLKITNIAKA